MFFILLLVPWDSESAGLFKKKKKSWSQTSSPSIETPATSNILISDDPYEQCRATVLPSFINNSMYWGDGKKTGKTDYRGLKALSPPSVIITAAGNKYYSELVHPLKSEASKDFNLIIVGSLKPDGTKSKFSQEGEEVHIAAPSNYEISSATNSGNYRRFGGTSGATPLVTGALAGFEWLAGYHPTAKESKILLEKTAIKTPISNQKPKKSGVGMLNSYKLAMVGKELKRLCGKNISCFKKNIQNPAIYKFPEDPGLKEEVLRAFPECHRQCGGTEKSCYDKAAVLKKLRKAAFLNPSNKTHWKWLACIYKNNGLTENAKGFFNTYKSLLPEGKEFSFCQSDADCVLAPHCSDYDLSDPFGSDYDLSAPFGGVISEIKPPRHPFLAMTKQQAEQHYTEKCSTKEICRQTRLSLPSGQEPIQASQNRKKVKEKEYASLCLNSQCVLRMETSNALIEPKKSPLISPPILKPKLKTDTAPPSGGRGKR